MVTAIIVIACVILYGAGAGLTWAIVDWDPGEEPACMFWPIILPAWLTHRLVSRLRDRIQEKRQAAEREKEELKKRVEELEKEMQEEEVGGRKENRVQ